MEKFSQIILRHDSSHRDDLFLAQRIENLKALDKQMKMKDLIVSNLIQIVKEQGETLQRLVEKDKAIAKELDILKKSNMIMEKDKATYLEDQRKKVETRLKIAEQLKNISKNKEKESNQEKEKLHKKLIDLTMNYIKVKTKLFNIEEEQKRNETKLNIAHQLRMINCDNR